MIPEGMKIEHIDEFRMITGTKYFPRLFFAQRHHNGFCSTNSIINYWPYSIHESLKTLATFSHWSLCECASCVKCLFNSFWVNSAHANWLFAHPLLFCCLVGTSWMICEKQIECIKIVWADFDVGKIRSPILKTCQLR